MVFLCGLKEGHLPFVARIKVGPAGGQRVRMRGWAGGRGVSISSQCAMVHYDLLCRQGALAGRHAFGGGKMNRMRIGGMLSASLAGWMPT